MNLMMPLAVLLVLLPTPAIAVQAGGAPTAASLVAMRDFGRCIVAAEGSEAAVVLAMDFRTPAYRDALRRLGRSNARCLPPSSELQSAQLLFAGALAEALLITRARKPLAGALALDPAQPAVEARGQSEVMALCVVRAEPAASASLIEAGPATPAEAQALASLSARLPACLAQGASMRLNRPGLRALIALAAYRVAAANGAVRGVSAGRA